MIDDVTLKRMKRRLETMCSPAARAAQHAKTREKILLALQQLEDAAVERDEATTVVTAKNRRPRGTTRRERDALASFRRAALAFAEDYAGALGVGNRLRWYVEVK